MFFHRLIVYFFSGGSNRIRASQTGRDESATLHTTSSISSTTLTQKQNNSKEESTKLEDRKLCDIKIIPLNSKVTVVKNERGSLIKIVVPENTSIYTVGKKVEYSKPTTFYTVDPFIGRFSATESEVKYAFPAFFMKELPSECKLLTMPVSPPKLTVGRKMFIFSEMYAYCKKHFTYVNKEGDLLFDLKNNEYISHTIKLPSDSENKNEPEKDIPDNSVSYRICSRKIHFSDSVSLTLCQDIVVCSLEHKILRLKSNKETLETIRQIYKNCNAQFAYFDKTNWDPIVHREEKEYKKIEDGYGKKIYDRILSISNNRMERTRKLTTGSANISKVVSTKETGAISSKKVTPFKVTHITKKHLKAMMEYVNSPVKTANIPIFCISKKIKTLFHTVDLLGQPETRHRWNLTTEEISQSLDLSGAELSEYISPVRSSPVPTRSSSFAGSTTGPPGDKRIQVIRKTASLGSKRILKRGRMPNFTDLKSQAVSKPKPSDSMAWFKLNHSLHNPPPSTRKSKITESTDPNQPEAISEEVEQETITSADSDGEKTVATSKPKCFKKIFVNKDGIILTDQANTEPDLSTGDVEFICVKPDGTQVTYNKPAPKKISESSNDYFIAVVVSTSSVAALLLIIFILVLLRRPSRHRKTQNIK